MASKFWDKFKKKNIAPATKVVKAAAQETPKKTAFETGRDGTTEDILKAFTDLQYVECRKLIQGAMTALKTGKPENIQFIFQNIDDKTRFGGQSVAYSITAAVLNDGLTSAQVMQALEKMAADKKQAVLDKALFYKEGQGYGEHTPASIQALAAAGANIHYGEEELLIVNAINGKTAIVETLHKLGADFKRAAVHAKTNNYRNPERLEYYRTFFTGEPAEKNLSEKITEMQQVLVELTKKVETVSAQLAKMTPQPSVNQPTP